MLTIYIDKTFNLWYFDVARRRALCLGLEHAAKLPDRLAETVLSRRLRVPFQFTRCRWTECKLLINELAVRFPDLPAFLVEGHAKCLCARNLADHVLERGLHAARRGRGHQDGAHEVALAAVVLGRLDRPGRLPDRESEDGLDRRRLPVTLEHYLKVTGRVRSVVGGKKTSPPWYRPNKCCCWSNWVPISPRSKSRRVAGFKSGNATIRAV